jgi:hypothetical protein
MIEAKSDPRKVIEMSASEVPSMKVERMIE